MLRNIKKKMYITYLKKHVASRWLRHPESREVRSLAEVLFFATNTVKFERRKRLNRCLLASLLLNWLSI